MDKPAGQRVSRPAGGALLWVLAGAAVVLLAYEMFALVTLVWGPLLANPQALQTDFHYYYDAAHRFAASPSRLYLATDDVIAGFAYPPPAIVPFVWLSKWPFGTALLAMTLASYLVLIGALQRWVRCVQQNNHGVDRRANAAVLLIALALGPTYMNAVFGQVNAFVLAAAIVFVTMAAAAPLEAGVTLALGAWLKIYPLLLVAVGVWERRAWRALLVALLALVGVAIVLLPIVPLDAYATFFLQVLPARADKTALHITNQSLVAFLERFRYPSFQFLNWTGEEAVTVSMAVRATSMLVAGVAIGWFARRARRGDAAAATAGLIALIAVLAPLGWGHTYVMVLPLVVLQLVRLPHLRRLEAGIVFTAVAALFVPAGRHLPLDAAPDWLQNILYSRYLLATFALMMVPLDSRPRQA